MEIDMKGVIFRNDWHLLKPTQIDSLFNEHFADVAIQKGDILVYGYQAVDQENSAYESQMYLAFMQTISQKMGTYAPFWEAGGPLLTWDNTDVPMGKRYFWGHIGIALKDGDCPLLDGYEIVVLRPTAALTAVVNFDQIVEKYRSALETTGPYNQPFYPAFMNWVKRLAKNQNHWLNSPKLQQLWLSNYGVDVTAPEIERLQVSSYLGTEYTDINDWRFWERSLDCSSLAAWAIIWGWYANFEQVRSLFLNNLKAVAAVDAIAPGQLAWWLVKNQLVEIVK